MRRETNNNKKEQQTGLTAVHKASLSTHAGSCIHPGLTPRQTSVNMSLFLYSCRWNRFARIQRRYSPPPLEAAPIHAQVFLHRKESQERDRLSTAAGRRGISKKTMGEQRKRHVRWLASELFMFERLGSGNALYTCTGGRETACWKNEGFVTSQNKNLLPCFLLSFI